jgi:anti-sigma B factor antagonist
MSINIEIEESGRNCTIKLSGKLNVYSSKEFYESISSLLQSYDQFQLNFSNLEELDSSGVQCLMYIKKLFTSKNKKIIYLEHSNHVLKTMETLGLVANFGDKIHLNATRKELFHFSYGTKKLKPILK